MANSFNQARDFFSDAYEKQQSAANQQAGYQSNVSRPQANDYAPTENKLYDATSPSHSSQTFMEDVKSHLINEAIKRSSRQRSDASPNVMNAGDGAVIKSVLPSY
jgi:hypothetical protein